MATGINIRHSHYGYVQWVALVAKPSGNEKEGSERDKYGYIPTIWCALKKKNVQMEKCRVGNFRLIKCDQAEILFVR